MWATCSRSSNLNCRIVVFTSLNFFLFFPAVCLLFYLTPIRFRWVVLLVASYFFYLNLKPIFALLIAGISISTYIFARLIDNTSDESAKKMYLRINVIL